MAKNIQKLIKLSTEYPELPIIAMVDGDIVGDDGSNYWMGQFGNVELGEYTLYKDHFIDDREQFKEEYYDYNDEQLCVKFRYNPRICKNTVLRGDYTWKQLDMQKQAEKELEAYLDEVAENIFKKAIIVNINIPDDI